METVKTNPPGLSPIYTAEEAAQYLRLDKVSLWRLRRSGKIRALKAGGKVLYTRAALEDFVTANTEA